MRNHSSGIFLTTEEKNRKFQEIFGVDSTVDVCRMSSKEFSELANANKDHVLNYLRENTTKR